MIRTPQQTWSEPQQIGPFRVVAQLGEGNLGRVFLGERIEGFAQRVAIKILNPISKAKPGDRDIYEGLILHSLDHENIVRILDRGITPEGAHYLVLEYVDGLAIDAYCARHRLTVEARLRLLAQVMEALSHAHQRLIVHADLKPANVLVTRTEQGDTVRLLDFGVAQTLQSGAHIPSSSYTPQFAAPEQSDGGAVTVATDIYALGLLSSLLLSGTAERMKADFLMSRKLRQLSGSDLEALAAERSTTGRALVRMLSGDLDAIVERALQLEPEARYPSVDSMREDVLRYLSGQVTSVLPANPVRRAAKWIRRNRVVAAASCVVASLLLFSAAGVLWRHAHVLQQRQLARQRLLEVIRLTGTLEGELYRSTAPLEGSEDARRSLIASTSRALDEIAAANRQDPVIALELVRQYSNLAKIEASETTDSSMPGQARRDAAKGLDLLQSIPTQIDTHELRDQLTAISAGLPAPRR